MRSTVFALCLTLVSSFAFAQSVEYVFEQDLNEYDGAEDTSIFSELVNNSGGGNDGVFVGTINQGGHRRALMWFDLTEIPLGSIVESVTLDMWVDRSGADFGDFNLSLHRLLKDWNAGTVVGAVEGGFGGPANEGDATWDSNLHSQSIWDDSGADFESAASATAAAGRSGDQVTWSGGDLLSNVQGWINAPGMNFGWLIRSEIEGQLQRVKKLHSAEAATMRPRLTIVTGPAPETDVNDDGSTNVIDMQKAINVVLQLEEDPRADVDFSGSTNIIDVQIIINTILFQ
jgi:hypothetical protein